ncbi:MAG: hypothetical protein AAGC71_16235, partial [Pseudomonadota bacterium]
MTNGVSRRAFVRLPVAIATLVGLSGCAPRREQELLTGLELVRAADQLALSLSLDNLRLRPRRNQPDRLVRNNPSAPATITFTLPPQHVAEAVFRASILQALPVTSTAASRTRLLFRLPEGMDGLDLSVDALLDWSQLELLWSGDTDDQVLPLSTAIEVPTGLRLNVPSVSASQWQHARQPVVWRGRTELWHSRLALSPGSDVSATVVVPLTDRTELDALDTALTRDERRALDGRTVQLRELMVTSSGAWLDVRGHWEGDTALARWQHRSAGGRDH